MFEELLNLVQDNGLSMEHRNDAPYAIAWTTYMLNGKGERYPVSSGCTAIAALLNAQKVLET